jgi:hypothetical protein
VGRRARRSETVQARVDIAASDALQIADRARDPGFLPYLNDAPLSCAKILAQGKGTGEFTVRFGELERKFAIDVVEPSDIASIDLLDANTVPEPRDMTDDSLTARIPVADVRGGRCRASLVVRGSTKEGRSTVLRLDAANMAIDPPTLATAYTMNAYNQPAQSLTLQGSASGEGTLKVTFGAATRTLPLRLDCHAR